MSPLIKNILFFIAAWLILVTTVWLAHHKAWNQHHVPSASSTAGILLKEAKLIEYFCLSRIPPGGGSASVPKAWSEVLATDIRLADNVGEVAGISPALANDITKIRSLEPGGHFATNDPSAQNRAYLVLRSSLNPNFMLVLAKDDAAATGAGTESGEQKVNGMLFIITGLAALLLTLLGSLLWGRSLKSA
jgi:hypothetical protein